MALYALGDLVPRIHPEAFIHPDCTIIGDVEIGRGSSVWPQAVLRADNGRIIIGEDSSVQDGSVLHTTPFQATTVGDRCVIGHIVHLEACVVEDDALVGNGAVVLHRARISRFSLVGSNAVVPNDMVVPSYAMALGVPAKIREGVVKPEMISEGARSYVANARRFRAELRRID
jgi:carbonic anhydrase/acetyltransferase-like protein (isoleucine patch superfamily)